MYNLRPWVTHGNGIFERIYTERCYERENRAGHERMKIWLLL